MNDAHDGGVNEDGLIKQKLELCYYKLEILLYQYDDYIDIIDNILYNNYIKALETLNNDTVTEFYNSEMNLNFKKLIDIIKSLSKFIKLFKKKIKLNKVILLPEPKPIPYQSKAIFQGLTFVKYETVPVEISGNWEPRNNIILTLDWLNAQIAYNVNFRQTYNNNDMLCADCYGELSGIFFILNIQKYLYINKEFQIDFNSKPPPFQQLDIILMKLEDKIKFYIKIHTRDNHEFDQKDIIKIKIYEKEYTISNSKDYLNLCNSLRDVLKIKYDNYVNTLDLDAKQDLKEKSEQYKENIKQIKERKIKEKEDKKNIIDQLMDKLPH